MCNYSKISRYFGIMNNNSPIKIQTFYSINDAINAPSIGKHPFILSNEMQKKNGSIGRYYLVFDNFNTFLKTRENYPHCHEIMVDHKLVKPDLAGRLVFDFDLKYMDDVEILSDTDDIDSDSYTQSEEITNISLSEESGEDFTDYSKSQQKTKFDRGIPTNFKNKIERTIKTTIKEYYDDVDISKLEFVWSSSLNPNKFSRHLTVKNMYFDDWLNLSKYFYKLFSICWDMEETWIKSKKLIDFQIVKKNGSLRMVGSSKINGSKLILDDDTYTLSDSLIRIYKKTDRYIEQHVTRENLNASAWDILNEEFKINDSDTDLTKKPKIVNNYAIQEPIYEKDVYQAAFKMYNKLVPGIFKIGKINGKIMTLMREKRSRCIISSKIHEHENAYCIIDLVDKNSEVAMLSNEVIENDYYVVKFGCYRVCGKYRTMKIGYLDAINLRATYDPYIGIICEKNCQNISQFIK